MASLSRRKRMLADLMPKGWRAMTDSPEGVVVRIKLFDGTEINAVKTKGRNMPQQRAWYPTRPPYRPIVNVVAWRPVSDVFPSPGRVTHG